MKIGILSDSHDHIPLLQAAVQNAIAMGAKAILHCGDVVAPSTLDSLKEYDIPLHVIHGNNSGDLYALTRLSHRMGVQIHYYGMDASLNLAGKRLFLVHYPHYARAMATTGDWDLVCCGHSHRVDIQSVPNVKGKQTILVNPGTVGGVGQSQATWVLGDLNQMSFAVQYIDKSIEFRAAL